MKNNDLLLLAVAGVGAYLLLKPKQPSVVETTGSTLNTIATIPTTIANSLAGGVQAVLDSTVGTALQIVNQGQTTFGMTQEQAQFVGQTYLNITGGLSNSQLAANGITVTPPNIAVVNPNQARIDFLLQSNKNITTTYMNEMNLEKSFSDPDYTLINDLFRTMQGLLATNTSELHSLGW
jgi:hypothetical protein